MNVKQAMKCVIAAALVLSCHSAMAEPIMVRAGVIPVLGAAPLFVADREGWLKDAGVEVTFVTFESGPNIIQAAARGDIDIYEAGVAPVALGRTKGIDFRVVAATAVDENVLAATPKLVSYFKAGPTPAAALKRFHSENGRPAKIATQPVGSVPATNLQYWLSEVAHADPADVQIVPIGIDATQQALLAGAVDAATVREPTLTIIQQKNPAIAIVAPGEELFPGQPGTVLGLSGAFIAKHPNEAQGIVKAVVKAVEKLKSEPDATLPAIETALSKGLVDTATLKKALSSPAVHFVADPKVIIGPTQAMLNFQVKIHAVAAAPEVKELFDTTFYDKVNRGH